MTVSVENVAFTAAFVSFWKIGGAFGHWLKRKIVTRPCISPGDFAVLCLDAVHTLALENNIPVRYGVHVAFVSLGGEIRSVEKDEFEKLLKMFDED